jgi:hypothetical protein
MPVGGIALMPFLTDATNAGMPLAIRGSQAATSCALGAPAAPVEWHAKQDVWYCGGAPSATAPTATLINIAAKSFFMRDPLSIQENNEYTSI